MTINRDEMRISKGSALFSGYGYRVDHAGASPYDEPRDQDALVGGSFLVIDQIYQVVDALGAQGIIILPDSGERWRIESGLWSIIEANNGDILRDMQAALI